MPTSLLSAPIGSAAPIENSPPGIHTMPSGAGPGGAGALAVVGRNVAAVDAGAVVAAAGAAAGTVAGFARDAPIAIAATTAMTATVTAMAAAPKRRGGGGGADGRLRRDLLNGSP